MFCFIRGGEWVCFWLGGCKQRKIEVKVKKETNVCELHSEVLVGFRFLSERSVYAYLVGGVFFPFDLIRP